MTVLVLRDTLTPTHSYEKTMNLFCRTKILITEEIQQLFLWLAAEKVDLLILDIRQQNAVNILAVISIIKKTKSYIPILLYSKGLSQEGKVIIEKEYGVDLIVSYNKDITKLINASQRILFDKHYNKDFNNDNIFNDIII